MRIIVCSDSHGNYEVLRRMVQKHSTDGDIFVHLGDGEREFERLKLDWPHKEMIGVCGNCDWCGMNKTSDILAAGGKKILMTHGHIFHVKTGLEELIRTAEGLNVSIVLYGHTHQAKKEYVDGIHYFNPGSIGAPHSGSASYGIVDITDAGIATQIVRL